MENRIEISYMRNNPVMFASYKICYFNINKLETIDNLMRVLSIYVEAEIELVHSISKLFQFYMFLLPD